MRSEEFDVKNPLGSNMKRLVIHKMSVDAIPQGGCFQDGIRYLSDKQRVSSSARSSREWACNAVDAVRLANDPNPYKEADDETIAGEILRRLCRQRSLIRDVFSERFFETVTTSCFQEDRYTKGKLRVRREDI